MNPRVARLPQFRGIPVPFFVTYRTDGIPDFKVMDDHKRRRCAAERLCWICGETIGYWLVFVGGPHSVKLGFFMDGPCHEECARDALELCPFLLGRTDYGVIDETKHEAHVRTQERVSSEAPARFALYKTRTFDVVAHPEGWFFRAAKAVSVEWYERGARSG